jgi:hypothetical protein
MFRFYHDGASAGQHEAPPTCLILAYGHARQAGLPWCSFRDFCRRHLALSPLGPRLTTEVVLRTLILPAPEDRN